MTALEVTVLGVPVTQGSMKVRRGRITHSDDKLMPWRELIAWHVRQECAAQGLTEPLDGPVAITATFTVRRPPSIPRSRWAPWVKPDIDKLARGLLDAVVLGGAIVGDSQVITLMLSKVYPVDGNLPGVTFTVAPAVRGEQVAA